MDEERIVEITTIKELIEVATAGNVSGYSMPLKNSEQKSTEKTQKETKMKSEEII